MVEFLYKKKKITSQYIDDENTDFIGTKTLDEIDAIQKMVINQDNIYVDPFKPLFLPVLPEPDALNSKTKTISNMNLTIKDFLELISEGFIDIINDLIEGNYTSITDLLLKENRGLTVAIFFIISSFIFLVLTKDE